MPYFVQRNFAGKVTGLFSGPQPQDDGHVLTDPDPLPDDHPEVVAFFAEHPMPDLTPLTEAQMEEFGKEQEQIAAEVRRLERLILQHTHVWSDLELSMSALLQQVLNIQGPGKNVARAVYFSIPGFEQRSVTVSRALAQYVDDHLQVDDEKYSELDSIDNSWKAIREGLRTARGIRNVIAHGSISIIPHGGGRHARLTAPVFDPIRVLGPLTRGSNPGIGPRDLEKSIELISLLSQCIDRVNDSLREFQEFGIEAFKNAQTRLQKSIGRLNSVRY